MKMKSVLLVVVTLSLSSLNSFAAPATCLEGSEELGSQKMLALIKQGLLDQFKKLKIAVNQESLQLKGSFSTHSERNFNDTETTNRGMFSLDDGKIFSAAGTEFELVLNGADDLGTYYAFYLPVAKNSGYDREGNPINPHCTLKADNPFVSNVASSVAIRNARSGKVIGSMSIPSLVSIY